MSSLSQAAEVRHQLSRPPLKVVAITSGKGGVGKTTIAANIAVALAAQQQNTLLLDADLSLANVDVVLGLQPRFNLAHVINGETDLDSTTPVIIVALHQHNPQEQSEHGGNPNHLLPTPNDESQ